MRAREALEGTLDAYRCFDIHFGNSLYVIFRSITKTALIRGGGVLVYKILQPSYGDPRSSVAKYFGFAIPPWGFAVRGASAKILSFRAADEETKWDL